MKRTGASFSLLWALVFYDIVNKMFGRPEPSVTDHLFMAELLLAGIIGYLVSIREQLKEKTQ